MKRRKHSQTYFMRPAQANKTLANYFNNMLKGLYTTTK